MISRAPLLLVVGTFSLTGCDAILGLGDYKEGPAPATGGAGGATSSTTGSTTTSSSGETTTTSTTGTMSSSASGTGGSGGAMTCTPNEVVPCPYLGTPGTVGHGHCAAGTMTCKTDGSGFNACIGQIVDMPENCTTGDDEDCDDVINNGCTCMPNQSVSCYSGPGGTDMTGICHRGNAICDAQGTALGPCMGEQTPLPEDCATTADENCNGAEMVAPGIDTLAGCECIGTSTQSCYSGPAATQNVGKCKSGTKVCNAGHYPMNCPNEVLPSAEMCVAASGDENCDGLSCSEPAWLVAAGDSNLQFGSDVAVDPAGNVYWVGQFTGTIVVGGTTLVSGGGDDLFVSKWTPSGTLLWVRRFGAAADQHPLAVAADSNNVYVMADTTTDFGGGLKGGMALAKLSSANGSHVWSRGCSVIAGGGGPLSAPTGAGLGIDPQGNVYFGAPFRSSMITCDGGSSLTGSSFADQAVVVGKYDANGNHKWSKAFTNTTGDVTLDSLAVDSAGSVWFAGGKANLTTFGCGSTLGAGSYVAKFDTNGACSFQTATGGFAFMYGLATDSAGAVILVGAYNGTFNLGTSLTSQGNYDVFVTKLSTTGAHVWSKSFGGGASDIGYDVDVDSADNVEVSGSFASSAITFGGPAFSLSGTSNAFIVKLAKANGAHTWSTVFPGVGASSGSAAHGIGVGGTNDLVYASGAFIGTVSFGNFTNTSAGAQDAFFTRIDP